MVVQNVVNSVMSSMTYVLSEDGCRDVWLVDCGDVYKILGIVGNRKIKGILLTHAHYDHIYGIPKILELYPECKIYTNFWGKEALASPKMNLSIYYEDSIMINKTLVCDTMEGDIVELFTGVDTRVYETPGHNPSCLCYAINNYLFTGDAYIPGTKVVTNLPGGDKNTSRISMYRIRALFNDYIILPGHQQTNING